MYDKYYQKKKYFGEPYPELVEYFSAQKRGTVIDLGAGQGRDSLFLAELGFTVTAVDVSSVGLTDIKRSNKKIHTVLADLNEVSVKEFDYILLDSMVHFYKKDEKKEMELLQKIHQNRKPGSLLVIAVQYSNKREEILNKLDLGTEEFFRKIMYNEYKSEFLIKAYRKEEER